MAASNTADVVIVGGGIIGCALAYFLQKQHITTIVLEKTEPGSQASGAAAGLLAPLGPLSGPGPLADLLLAGFRQFPSLVAELEAATGLHVQYAQTGALRTTGSPRRVAHLRKRWERWQPLGLRMDWLSPEEARQREPRLTTALCAAVYVPEEAQVDAVQMTRAFALAARQLGAQFQKQQEVDVLIHAGQRVVAVRTHQQEEFACGALFLATGAWSAQWEHWLQLRLPVTPLHGQLLTLPQTIAPLRAILFGEGIYLVPRGEVIIVGATREERGFAREIAPEGTAWLLQTARRLVPELAQSEPRAIWSGLRPRTPDARPLLGRSPNWENVFLATGHNSTGILLSGITGQCLTEQFLTGEAPALIQPFCPDPA